MTFVCSRTVGLRTPLWVLLVLLGMGLSVRAQDPGSTPVELSVPKAETATPTNTNRSNTRQTRLTELEERLSKVFDFFRVDDSLSGMPTFRAPARPTTVVKPTPSSGNTGDLNNDWLQEDIFPDLPGFAKDTKRSEDSPDPGNADFQDQKSTLLDSLRGDDWLVKGTMGETFWEIPVLPNRNESDRTPWDAGNRFKGASEERKSEEDLRSRLDGLLGRSGRTVSPLDVPDYRSLNSGSLDPFNSGPAWQREAQNQRRDEYRELLGMNPKPAVESTKLAPLNGSFSSTMGGADRSYLNGTPSGLNSRSGSPNSLYPVRSPERESIYSSSPYTPQRPSVTDPLELEPQTSPNTLSPERRVSSPLYQAPRRQF